MSVKISIRKAVTQAGILLAFLVFLSSGLAAQHNNAQHEEWEDVVEDEEFNAGKMIIEHITDSYEWHVITYGETHISIYLPVILYDKGEWIVFMSNKFHHGHDSYKGYFISKDNFNSGKIVRVDEQGLQVRPDLDISITKNVVGIFMSMIFMIIIFISIANSYKRRKGQAPKGLQSFLEPIIIFIRDDIAKASIGDKYEKYLPFLLTIFFFVLINNILGIIPFFPGGANVTGNIGVAGVLAMFTFIITTFSGNKAYWTHLVNAPGVPWWLKLPIPLMPIVEIIGVFTKPFVLMVRLFANITAGHIIILGFVSLIFIFGKISEGLGYGVSIVSISFSIFMDFLELLVAFIQAYVFTLLSALYFGMATEEHH